MNGYVEQLGARYKRVALRLPCATTNHERSADAAGVNGMLHSVVVGVAYNIVRHERQGIVQRRLPSQRHRRCGACSDPQIAWRVVVMLGVGRDGERWWGGHTIDHSTYCDGVHAAPHGKR